MIEGLVGRRGGGGARLWGPLLILATGWAAVAPAQQARVLSPSPATVVEIEDLAAFARVRGGDVVVQPMSGFGPGWGADAQLFWRAAGPAPTLAFDLEVPAAGEWDLELHYTVAPDYARFAVRVAGQDAGEVDGYATAVAPARRSLGRHRLAAGPNPVVIAVSGRHAASTGWIVGLDRIEAVRAAALPGAASPTLPTGRQGTPSTAPPATALTPGRPRIIADALPAAAAASQPPRLEIQTWGAAGRGGLQARWEPRRVRLEWDRQDLRVRLRWQASGSADAVWQVYADVPPPAGRASPLATGPLSGGPAGAWQEFEIDLLPFKPADLPDLAWAGLSSPAKARPRLFVRVQPAALRGAPPPPASNLVEIKFSHEPVGKLKLPARLTVTLVDSKPVHPYDQRFLCWAVATRDGPPKGIADLTHPKDPMWHKGDKRGDLCDHDDSGGVLGFLEDFGSALAGAVLSFVDSIGSAVDQVSALYSEVKGSVLELAAAPLASLGCGDPCEGALSLALDAALVSAGVPPSLPDFAQVVQGLEEGGIDAVTDTLVETAVSQGLPADQIPGAREAARAAVAHLVDQAKKKVAAGGSGKGGGWGPDLSRAYSPAVLVFEIRNVGAGRSQPAVLQLIQEDAQRAEVALPLWQKLPVGGYEPSWTPVPALERGTATRVAVTLRPETDPHLWLELWYGRSSMLPPQEWCDRDYRNEPQKLNACRARMQMRGDLQYRVPFELNRAWDEVYARRPARFGLRLFRFAQGGPEGIEAAITCDAGGPCRMTGGTTP